MMRWHEKWGQIRTEIKYQKEKLEEYLSGKLDKLEKLIDKLPSKELIECERMQIQNANTLNKDKMMKELRSWYYKEWEKNDTYCTIIMIPYDYFNNETLVIHHGKRIDMSHFNNLSLDWDYNGTPGLTIDK